MREHIIERCEEEANRGNTHYTIYLTKGNIVVKDLLFTKCLELAKEFEECGYNVVIKNYKDTDDRYVDFAITFSWGSESSNTYKEYNNVEVLYATKLKEDMIGQDKEIKRTYRTVKSL